MVEREVKIETVPQRVARAALQLDETGVNGSSFHAQIGRIRHDERGPRPVQIPPRAHNPHGVAPSHIDDAHFLCLLERCLILAQYLRLAVPLEREPTRP